MKRLIFALALLMPFEAMAVPSDKVMRDGKVLAVFKDSYRWVIISWQDNVYRCAIETWSYSCHLLKEK